MVAVIKNVGLNGFRKEMLEDARPLSRIVAKAKVRQGKRKEQLSEENERRSRLKPKKTKKKKKSREKREEMRQNRLCNLPLSHDDGTLRLVISISLPVWNCRVPSTGHSGPAKRLIFSLARFISTIPR